MRRIVRCVQKGKRPFRRGVREAALGCVAGKKIRFFPPGTEAKKGDCAPFLEFPPRAGGIFLRLWAAGEGRKKTEILRSPKSCPIDEIIGAWYAI